MTFRQNSKFVYDDKSITYTLIPSNCFHKSLNQSIYICLKYD